MSVAIRLIRDYVEVNLRRTRNDFITMYASIMAIQLAALFRYNSAENWLQFLGILLLRALDWLIFLVFILSVLFFITAYFKLLPLARNAAMLMRDYIRSKDYTTNGKQQLRRTDKERKWW